jgi:hypothetical protein
LYSWCPSYKHKGFDLLLFLSNFIIFHIAP